MNIVVLIGRLTRDPELRYASGTSNPMARFTVAVDRQLSREKKAEMESKGQPTADFINVVVWGRQAENCAQYLQKGRMVAINGRIQTGSYQANDGTRKYTTDVVANQVQFLERADARPQGQGGYSQNYAPNNTGLMGQGGLDLDEDFFGSDFKPIDDDKIPF